MMNKFLTSFVALALLSQPVYAESIYRIEGITDFIVEMKPNNEEGCPYYIQATNGLRLFNPSVPDVYNTTLSIGEVKVKVKITLVINPAPDLVEIETPEGLISIPQSMEVNEGGDFIFKICNPAEMLMGSLWQNKKEYLPT